jgi:predicted Rossmann fold flavoprotein
MNGGRITMKVIVIGGGPAGIIAALTARNNGNEVTILEKMRSVGRKLSITGKGRCNITNMTDIDNFIKNIPGNGKFLFSVFNRYSNVDLLNYLNSLGIQTKTERGQRVFPASDNALEIVEKLKREIDNKGIKLIVNSKVEKLLIENNKIVGVETSDKTYNCDKVILATGGKSYPLTGSSGDGYELVKKLGHTIIEPKASLVPVETYEKPDLQGLSLKNVNVSITDDKKVIYEEQGEMIFTHYGVSGPVILSASSHLLRVKEVDTKLNSKNIKLHIDLKPALSHEKLDARIQRDFEKYTRKQYKNCLVDLLPSKLIPYIIELSKIPEEKQIDQITKEERTRLVELLKNLEFTIKKFRPIDEAIITAGGINIKEINSTTMESKIVEGLYFAGEIIDVDAYTGGFNLQIAFSTGYTAGLLLSN